MKQFLPTGSERQQTRQTQPAAMATPAGPSQRLMDNRPELLVQRKLKETINAGPKMLAQRKLVAELNNSPHMVAQRELHTFMNRSAVQLQAVPEEENLLQGKFKPVQKMALDEEKSIQGKFATAQLTTGDEEKPLQQKPNHIGLPDNLKNGIENLSGYSMDDVKVHYNSDKPAQLNAHAYAQGTDIHVAPGQEQHLPHEAWHVVQQKQGRVRPTMQMKAGVPVNDDMRLESEADLMGAKALQEIGSSQSLISKPPLNTTADAMPAQRAIKDATVIWGITHTVEFTDDSLFGGEDALANELSPSDGGQLEQGDKLRIDDAPVVISRRGSNQEDEDKRAKDKEGNKVYEWVRVLKITPQKGQPHNLDENSKIYVRKETITIIEKETGKKSENRNKISLLNIENWKNEEIPDKLRGIAEKWETQGRLRRTKSKGVLSIDEQDMKKQSEGGREKPSGRNWDQEDEGVQVATNIADEDHEPFDLEKGQWRIKAVNEGTNELVGVLIVENDDPLYLRWLIGNPEIKGGGSALLAAVKKLLLDEENPDTIKVTSAYSAKDAYTKSGFKEKEEVSVSPGEEFTLTLSKNKGTEESIPSVYREFKPEKYKYTDQ